MTGLQHERTQLAWARTSLSATVTSLLLMRLTLDAGIAERFVVGWSFIAAATLSLAARHRVQALRLGTVEAPPPAMLRTVTGVQLVLVALELTLALT